MNATGRYVLRVVLNGVSAASASLLTAMPGLTADDLIQAALLGVVFALGYAGIGASSRNVEPNIGRSTDTAPELPPPDA